MMTIPRILIPRLTALAILPAIFLATFVKADESIFDECLETTLRTAEQVRRLTKGTPMHARGAGRAC
jgi:hypothetical protein